MEIKAELKQPYTENERLDFIVEQNHKLGYEIRQVETTYEVEIKVPSVIKETITETIQVPVLDENGYPILDEDGNPTFEEKTIEREVERTETEIIAETIEVPVFDEEGNQTYETKTIEKEVTKYRTEIVEKIGYNLEAWGYTEKEITEQERERINMLFLTGADVERGIYQAKGMDFDDIMAFVMANPPEGLDVKALRIELKANNFYRGNPYVNAVGALLGFTSEQLDKFFKTKDYKYLTTCTLTVNPTPESSLVVINSEIQKEITVPYGSVVDVVVSNDGYFSHADVLTLTEDRVLDIELVKEVEDENTTDTTDIPDEVDTTTSEQNEVDTDSIG